MTADVRPLGFDDGLDFCRTLPERCGVVAVPNSVFYADPAQGRHLVRFAFCKRHEVLAEAADRPATHSARGRRSQRLPPTQYSRHSRAGAARECPRTVRKRVIASPIRRPARGDPRKHRLT